MSKGDAAAASAGVPMNEPQSSNIPRFVEPPTSEATPVERSDVARLALMMRSAILMLGYAVDDVERGLWTRAERERLAKGLNKLVEALRDTEAGSDRMVIDVERTVR